MAIVEVCDEIDHYIINGKYIEVWKYIQSKINKENYCQWQF
jgi:hypothetical protein